MTKGRKWSFQSPREPLQVEKRRWDEVCFVPATWASLGSNVLSLSDSHSPVRLCFYDWGPMLTPFALQMADLCQPKCNGERRETYHSSTDISS